MHGYKYFIPHCDYNWIIERDFNKHVSHFFGIEYTDCPLERDNYEANYFRFNLKYLHELQNVYYGVSGGKELKLSKEYMEKLSNTL